MSLINQMLRDLEKRQGHAELNSTLVLHPYYPINNNKFKTTYLRNALIVIISIALLYVGAQRASLTSKSHHESLAQSNSITIAAAPNAKQPAASLEPEPVALTRKTIEQKMPADPVEQVNIAPKLAPTPVVDAPQALPIAPAAKPEQAQAATIPKSYETKKITLDSTQLHKRALAAYREGDYAQAESYWIQATSISNPSQEALLHYSLFLVNTDQAAQAEILLRTQISLPNAPIALTNLYIKILLQQEKTEVALAQLQTLRSLNKLDIESTGMLAALLQKKGDHASAVTLYQKIVTKQSDNAIAWMGLGISQEALANPSAAFKAYQNAIALPSITTDLKHFMVSRMQQLNQTDVHHDH